MPAVFITGKYGTAVVQGVQSVHSTAETCTSVQTYFWLFIIPLSLLFCPDWMKWDEQLEIHGRTFGWKSFCIKTLVNLSDAMQWWCCVNSKKLWQDKTEISSFYHSSYLLHLRDWQDKRFGCKTLKWCRCVLVLSRINHQPTNISNQTNPKPGNFTDSAPIASLHQPNTTSRRPNSRQTRLLAAPPVCLLGSGIEQSTLWLAWDKKSEIFSVFSVQSRCCTAHWASRPQQCSQENILVFFQFNLIVRRICLRK